MTNLHEFDKNRSQEELVAIRQMDRELIAELKALNAELLEALKMTQGWGYGQPPPCSEEEIVEKLIKKAEAFK